MKVAPCAPAAAAGDLAVAVRVGAVAGEQVAGAALAEALLLSAGKIDVRGDVAAPKGGDAGRAGVRRRRRGWAWRWRRLRAGRRAG